MGIFTDEVPKTSITFYIERLSNYEEIDWYILQQLTESILMQENGPHEAIEAVRKRLKHGTTQQKLRVFEVLKLLMENTNEKFHRQLVTNEKMRERFDLILSSSSEDMRVKKELLSLLGAWAIKYKSEPGMHVLGDMFESGRKKLGLPKRIRSASSAETGRQPSSPVTPEASSPVAPSMPPRPTAQKTPSPKLSKRQSLPPAGRPSAIETRTKPRSSSTSGSQTRVFNLEAAKPKIIQEVALANQNTNNLINALKFINTNEDRWEIDLQHDARLQDYRQRCEESKKKIVRYARLVEDEEWIGTLLATNEELLKALQMYESMSVGQVPANLPSPPAPSSPVTTSPPHHIRSPPPPPPVQSAAAKSSSVYVVRSEETLRDLAGLQIQPKNEMVDEADPFADPVTPIDEDRRPFS